MPRDSASHSSPACCPRGSRCAHGHRAWRPYVNEPSLSTTSKEHDMTAQTVSAAPTDTSEAAIAGLRDSIDLVDREILELLEDRRRLSEEVQRVRMASGGRRTELGRENVIIRRYADRLGRPGGAMALALLEFCRGSTGVLGGGAPR
ncbi:chorismate mutase [Streptomyces sp. NBC_01264]|uniref:chorismate mutase n=1 Tax=Streptomyces sp. NBC_01264 TaxID=2903804 RepID=UPI00224E9ABA|nr:chorismate mutase [Streptomyces sp. NBC_01264]MCX4783671.1 chorismate mutase [Streptomyces sp. NBC_01264]